MNNKRTKPKSTKPQAGVENKEGPPPIVRVRQIQKWFQVRYGFTLPNDAIGRSHAFVMCCHLIRCPDAVNKMRNWFSLNTPWMKLPERDAMMAAAIREPYDWSADTLAHKIGGVTDADRTLHGLWTIGSIDVPKAEREARRRERARQREQGRRRKRNAKPRAEWLAANNISRTKPWLAAGVSRATYYRLRKVSETGPCAVSLESNMVGTDLSHPTKKGPTKKESGGRRAISITEGYREGGVFPSVAVSRTIGM
jgi:hypothetical protein